VSAHTYYQPAKNVNITTKVQKWSKKTYFLS
jgi:hypothetical protein